MKRLSAAIGVLAGTAIIWALGVAAALCTMRLAVGRYDWDDAVLGLSPANLAYSLRSGYWAGGISAGILLITYFVSVSLRVNAGNSLRLSVALALAGLIAIMFVNWLSWIV